MDDEDAGLIEMDGKQRERLRVVQKLRKRHIRQGQAARQSGWSVRQVERLARTITASSR
jgi:hypothetical protein